MPGARVPEMPLRRWWEGAGSPGPGGYVVSVLVSAGVLGPILVLGAVGEMFTGESDLVDLALAAVYLSYVALFSALPFAVPGVLAVHLLCLPFRAQWVHVLAAAGAGALSALVAVAVVDASGFGWFPVQLGLATAFGRTAVVRFVPGVRRRRAQRLQASAAPPTTPVDDDFRPGA